MLRKQVGPSPELASIESNGSGQLDVRIVATAFKDQLLAQSTHRGRRSVERIWTVCAELIANKERLTVARVGRETEARWGSPKAQSIRDQPDRLKRLVELCAAMQREQGQAKSARKSAPDRLEEMLSEIGDQSVRARLRAIAEERDRLRNDVAILKQAYQRLMPIDELTVAQCYEEVEPMPRSAPALNVKASLTALTELEKSALRTFLSEDFLYGEGLRIDAVLGLVREESGRIVLPVAFLTALRKVSE